MKSIFVFLALSTGLFTSANTALAFEQASSSSKIKETKELRVCVAIVTPWMFKDLESNEFIGFDVEMIHEFCSYLQVTPKLIPVPGFGQLIASLQTGKCDVIMSGLMRTARREGAVAFSDSYFELGAVWGVRRDRTDLNAMEDLNKPSVTIAVETGGWSEEQTRNNLPGAKIKSLPGGGDALRLTEVLSKRSDAFALENVKIKYYQEQFPWIKFIPADGLQNPVDPAGVAYATRRGNVELCQVLNEFIHKMRSTGKIDQLIKKWMNGKYVRLR